ncbi:MAG TPA: RNA-binding transcriptional accessory protein, partial [Campylobacterales bacterium]|nr:RNA-binding transcriptional accessory protein [Campylobacterales bacterium]
MQDLLSLLEAKTLLKTSQIKNILSLMDKGATIPFIARYRKEMTGGASDEELREFDDIYSGIKRLISRRGEIVKLLKDKNLFDSKIENKLSLVNSMGELEDIYRPFKQKKTSRATKAITLGLEPLANQLQSAKLSVSELKSEARKYIKNDVTNIDMAIKGAQDIIAERFSDSAKEREVVRKLILTHAILEVKSSKKFDEKGVFFKYK